MFNKMKGLGKKADKPAEPKGKAKDAKGGGDKAKQQKQLLGLLVLIAGGAAAWFYLNSGDMMTPPPVAPAPPAAKVAARQKVTVPPEVAKEKQEQEAKAAPQNLASRTPQAQPAAEPATAAKPAEAAAPMAQPAAQPAPAVATAAPQAKQQPAAAIPAPVAPAKPAPVAAVPAATKATQAAPAKPVAAAMPAADPAPMTAAAPAPAAAAATSPYYVNAGAYVVKANASKAQKAIKAAGFTPDLSVDKRKVKMTRLRVGTFDRATSDAKIRELNRYGKGAFRMQKGSQWVVYAGSFYNLDQGRRYADLLYKNGIETEEEYAQIQMPLTVVTFGAFATKEEARAAAKKIQRKGIEAAVAKR